MTSNFLSAISTKPSLSDEAEEGQVPVALPGPQDLLDRQAPRALRDHPLDHLQEVVAVEVAVPEAVLVVGKVAEAVALEVEVRVRIRELMAALLVK